MGDKLFFFFAIVQTRNVGQLIFKSLASQLGNAESHRKRDQGGNARRIGTAAERDDKTSGTTFSQVIEQAQGHRAGTFLLFESGRGLPGLFGVVIAFWGRRGKGKITMDNSGRHLRYIRLVAAYLGSSAAGAIDINNRSRELYIGK